MEKKLYIKRPTPEFAIQWDGTEAGADTLAKAFPKAPIRVLESCPIQIRLQLTPMTEAPIVEGDYVVETKEGYLVYDKKVFEDTYKEFTTGGLGGGPAKELLPPGIIPEPKPDVCQVKDLTLISIPSKNGMVVLIDEFWDVPFALEKRKILKEPEDLFRDTAVEQANAKYDLKLIRVLSCHPAGESSALTMRLPMTGADIDALEAELAPEGHALSSIQLGWMKEDMLNALDEFDGW